jgi:hypothetical protein
MLTAKQKHPAARNSEGGSDIDLGCISSPHVGKLSDNYEYSGDDKALSIRETLNCSILSMLVLLFFLSIAAYAVILGLRYIVVRQFPYRPPLAITGRKKIACNHKWPSMDGASSIIAWPAWKGLHVDTTVGLVCNTSTENG